MKITRPTLVVNEAICRKNIAAMADKAKRNNCQLIPHFKTHQSKAIGAWFKEYGVEKITVSSVRMAEYFAEAGWKDIYIAFPVNVLEVETINRLASTIDLTILISNEAVLDVLLPKLNSEVGVRIEVDTGAKRTGFSSDAYHELESVINRLQACSFTQVVGFYSHAGHSYAARGRETIKRVFEKAKAQLLPLKRKFGLPVGFGDTPCCSIVDDFTGFDSLHPGNFVFYDVMQTRIGSCTTDQIAVALAVPVVDVKSKRNEVIVHGGAVHLSKDRFEVGEQAQFGLVSIYSDGKWSNPVAGSFVKVLSQEHGIVHMPDDFINKIQVGDVLAILPIHSCLTADCMGVYLSSNGNKMDHLKGRI